MKNENDTVGQLIHVDMISRDRDGNVVEHIRTYPDGKEEVVKARGV